MEAEKLSAKWSNPFGYQQKQVRRWLKTRSDITGQPTNELIKQYGLEEWFPERLSQEVSQSSH